MKILLFVENISTGGMDTFCENLINFWPVNSDNFYLIVNKSHPGISQLRKNIYNKNCKIMELDIPLSWVYVRKISKIFPNQLALMFGPLFRIILYFFQKSILKKFFANNSADCLISISGGFPGGESNRIANIVWKELGLKRNIYNFHNLAQRPRVGLKKIESFLDSKLDNSVDKYIGVSDPCIKSVSIRDYSFNSDKFLFIHNGVKVKENSKDINLRKICGLKENHFICIVLGTLEDRKGHKFIIDSCKNLFSNTEINIVIVGPGSNKQISKLRKIIADSGHSEKIHYLGYISNAANLIKQADLLLIGSQEYESFGLTAIEAMQFGIPIVSTDVGGLPEVIGTNFSSGILCPNNDEVEFSNAIYSLYSNKELYRKIQKNSFQRYTNMFTPEVMTKKYLQVIKKI